MSLTACISNHSPIDSLPPEILLEVFNYFNGKELKCLMLICRKWHQIISQATSTMAKLPLNFTFFKVNPGVLLHKYHSAKIVRESLIGIKLLTAKFQRLEAINNIYDISDLNVLLENFQHLQYLTLTRIQVRTDEVKLDERPRGLVLKKLELIQTDYEVLNVLKNYQVKHLEIIDSTNKCSGDALNNFFSSQRNLETLVLEELTKNSCLFFNSKEYSYDYEFKLKKLSVLYTFDFQNSTTFETNFGTFFNNQSHSLEILKVEGLLPTAIFKLIVSSTFLNELEINARGFPQEKLFYESMHINQRLTILKINSTITRENFLGIKEFISRQRGVKKLNLMDTDEFIANDLFAVISSKLNNLTRLSILNFNSNFKPCASIKSLQYFSIKILNDINQWQLFVLLHNLKCIKVGWIPRDFDVEVIKQIINSSNIKHMTFGGRFIANKKIYNAFKDDYKNLRTLKLRVSNYDEIKDLKFIFPLDRAQYEPKCLYFDENNDREPLND